MSFPSFPPPRGVGVAENGVRWLTPTLFTFQLFMSSEASHLPAFSVFSARPGHSAKPHAMRSVEMSSAGLYTAWPMAAQKAASMCT
ncbi:hypothetical protein NOGI109294_19930 [Nocardiopsis gilva]